MEVFQYFYELLLGGNVGELPESYLYLSQTVSHGSYPLVNSVISGVKILGRESVQTLEHRFNAASVLYQSMIRHELPNLVIIAPKGSMKTTFKQYIETKTNSILIIDSDDFGRAISQEYFLTKTEGVITIDTSENFIINWFRLRLSEFDIPLSGLTERVFDNMSNFSLLMDEFHTFWKEMYDKGYGGVPGFLNYVNERVKSEGGDKNMVIILTHNIFEARLCASKSILCVKSGLKSDMVL